MQPRRTFGALTPLYVAAYTLLLASTVLKAIVQRFSGETHCGWVPAFSPENVDATIGFYFRLQIGSIGLALAACLLTTALLPLLRRRADWLLAGSVLGMQLLWLATVLMMGFRVTVR